MLYTLLPGFIGTTAAQVGKEAVGLHKQDIVSGAASLVPQRQSQVSLTHSHRTTEDNGLLAFDKLAGSQLTDILGG